MTASTDHEYQRMTEEENSDTPGGAKAIGHVTTTNLNDDINRGKNIIINRTFSSNEQDIFGEKRQKDKEIFESKVRSNAKVPSQDYIEKDKKHVIPSSKTISIRFRLYVPHFLWIGVCIAMLIALYFAYMETTKKSTLDLLLPRVNITVTKYQNGTTSITKSNPQASQYLSTPQIPRFVLLWGFIGSAAYVLKVVTGVIGGNRYDNSYLPYHISRLVLGPALAAAAYFILLSGSIFGLSFDISKVDFQTLPYLYATVAFVTGYFVRPIINALSKMVNAIFNMDIKS